MTIGRTIKKGFRTVGRKIKKRYTTKTGGVRIKKLTSDVYKIQRMLNVEHKHLDFKVGSSNLQHPIQQPTRTNPIIIPIPMPHRGTSFNERVGNQIRIVHMTAKYNFKFTNNTDLKARTTVRAQILFAKNATNIPVITQLYELDANNHYTPNSFVDTQEYKKFMWIKSLDAKKSHQDMATRYLQPSWSSSESTQDGQTAANSVHLQDSEYYVNKMTKTSVKVLFHNNTDNVSQNMAYLLLTSDVIDGSPEKYDPVKVSANIRFTYVDN